MPSTHRFDTSIAAGTSSVAGTPTIGTASNMTTNYGGLVTGILTNGATGPTLQASAYIEVSGDNVNWKQFYVYAGGTVALAATPFSCELPMGTMYARVRVADNTGQSVTCEAFIQVLATI